MNTKEIPAFIHKTVRNCPICKCLHLELKFRELPRPNPDGSTHVGVCPVEGKRILLTPPPAK